MVCLKHPDREAVTVCAACGKPLCAECVVAISDRSYCSELCAEKGEASRVRAVETMAVSRKIDKKSRFRAIVWLLILLAAAAGIWFCYHKNEKQINGWFENNVKKIRKTTDKTIDDGQGYLSKDSRYKRDREALLEE